jgi:mannose-6-phosphate isomerase-like protein (cupin superfamily)
MRYLKESDSTNVRIAPVHEGTGEIRIRHFFKGASQTGVNFHVWELAPGVSEGKHIHAGDENYEETYYFIQGEGMMWIDDEEVPVTAGDAVLVPPGVDHGFQNTGRIPLKLVLLFGKPVA